MKIGKHYIYFERTGLRWQLGILIAGWKYRGPEGLSWGINVDLPFVSFDATITPYTPKWFMENK